MAAVGRAVEAMAWGVAGREAVVTAEAATEEAF